MAKIIRVDVSRGAVNIESVPEKYLMLGGRGLVSQLLLDEIDPACAPLGEENKLVFALGLLGGTKVSTSGRLSIGAKSPLTGGIKEANSGGVVGRQLCRLGIKAVILEGKPLRKALYVLKINNQGATLLPAGDLTGLGNYKLAEILIQTHGPKTGLITIGQAGEMQLGAAAIAISDLDGKPNRFAGRGGLGAVMGSKGIKAIVVDDSEPSEPLVDPVHEDEFNTIAKNWNKELAQKKILTEQGTPFLVKTIAEIGGTPTRNFSRGVFENWKKIGAESMVELIKTRGGKVSHACQPGCVIRCSSVFNDAEGNPLVNIEYETLALMGANLEIDSLDAIAAMNRKCNDFGLDTMEIGCALGVAMEGGLAQFGDAVAAEKLIDEIGKGTVLGRLIGNGATLTGKVLGVSRVPTVKGQSMAGYDPRVLKGTGVTYATSPMGADHTAGNLILGREGVDSTLPDGQIKASRDIQAYSTVLDNMGLCNFCGGARPTMEILAQLLTKATGRDVDVDEVIEMGRNTLRCERKFNELAGFTKADDRLPRFFTKECLSPTGLAFDVQDRDLDDVFNF
ncbi:MAG TPA: aldehyde ferredoxin oxidoreductase C-terminal domain-containing protein [Syntrophales bacterium]|nr:aldehyde ferredoxin oxidoreductase C-terminal domain-containing protein [Syntrophales bacterium]